MSHVHQQRQNKLAHYLGYDGQLAKCCYMRARVKHDQVSTLSPFITSYLKEDQAIVGISMGSEGTSVAGRMTHIC